MFRCLINARIFIQIFVCVFTFAQLGHFHIVSAEIQMTEVYPAPSTGFEWVEICNAGTDPISLAEYVLQDSSGKKLYMPNILLQPQQYVLATSSGVLNNAGDTITLLKNSITLDTMTYLSAPTHEQSYIACNAVWSLTDDVTPGFENTLCTVPTAIVTPTIVLSPSPTLSASLPTPTHVSEPILVSHISSVSEPQASPITAEIGISYAPKRILESFTVKHAPLVRGVETSSPKKLQQSASSTQSEQIVTHQSPIQTSTLTLAALLSALATCTATLIVYRTAKSLKSSYNNMYDAEAPP